MRGTLLRSFRPGPTIGHQGRIDQMRFMTGLVAGVAIGAAGAVAYSIRTGRDLRDVAHELIGEVRAEIRNRDLEDITSRIEERVGQVQAQVGEAIGQAKSAADAATDDASDAVGDVASESADMVDDAADAALEAADAAGEAANATKDAAAETAEVISTGVTEATNGLEAKTKA